MLSCTMWACMTHFKWTLKLKSRVIVEVHTACAAYFARIGQHLKTTSVVEFQKATLFSSNCTTNKISATFTNSSSISVT